MPTIRNKFETVFANPEPELLSVSDIKNRVWEFDKQNSLTLTNKDSIFPSDYCYNRTNDGASGLHIFELSTDHKYKCLGINYPYTGNIIHKTKLNNVVVYIDVGYWEKGTKFLRNDPNFDLIQDEEYELVFLEGNESFKLHKVKERNQTISKIKKNTTLKETGKLVCEVCEFDFYRIYGDLGLGYIECHHNNPISTLTQESETRVGDLSLLCANCHRMIHRIRPWITVNELKAIIKKQ